MISIVVVPAVAVAIVCGHAKHTDLATAPVARHAAPPVALAEPEDPSEQLQRDLPHTTSEDAAGGPTE
eukprot:SAG31_NODE_36792_length_310_cov_0.734597_1_plen_67_part_01